MLDRLRGRPREDPDLEELRRLTAARLAAIVGLGEEPDLDGMPEPSGGVEPVGEPTPLVLAEDVAGEADVLATTPAEAADEAPTHPVEGPSETVEEPPPAVIRPLAGRPIELPANAVAVMGEATPVGAPVAGSVGSAVTGAPVAATTAQSAPVVGDRPGGGAGRRGAARREAAAPRGPARGGADVQPSPDGAGADAPPGPTPRRTPPPARQDGAGTAAAGSRAAAEGPTTTARRPTAPTAVPSPARPAARRPGRRSVRTDLAAACPTCGRLLEEIPTATRRCPGCRARIVVKRLEGRTVLLAEPVVPLFEAERRRVADAERLTRECGGWLRLAALAGAPPDMLEARARAVAARPTPEAVTRARRLYATTVERASRAARRRRDWKTVADLRWRQARAYHRAAGSPAPPEPAAVALHQEALEASLRRIAEVGREAEVVGGTCCDACRSDTGRTVRISAEIKAPSLPHAGCPLGLCGCLWDIPARRRAAVSEIVRPRSRPAKTRAAPAATPAR